jgi:PI31 proteasome regulator N-terminal
MPDDVLSPSVLLSKITSSADVLTSPLQALAAFSHASMLALDFRFIGFGEDHNAGIPQTTSISDTVELEFDEHNVQTLWTSESDSHTEFRYAHPQSAMRYLVKVSRMAGKTIIMGMAWGVDRTVSLEVVTRDYTSEGFFPWTSGDGREVVGGYIGEHRLRDLASLMKINILQKLISNLNKEGYSEETTAEEFQSETYPRQQPPRQRQPPEDLFDPLRIPTRTPDDPEHMPSFEDPYDLTRPPPVFPSRSPLAIGSDDLNPPPFLGPGGFRPPGANAPDHQGMFMDIRGRGRANRPPGVPPGARWDPIGPFSGRGRGRGGNPFSGYGSGDFI